MKKLLLVLLVFCTIMCIAAEITITKVQQRYPWNGLVDIEYSVSEKSNCSLGLKIVDNYTGKEYKGRTFDKVPPTTVGSHKITWNSIADGVKLNSDNVEVFFEEFDPLYIVVHLSSGTSAASYPVTALSDVPDGGWTDEYKTTKLVLRKITAGKMPRTDVDITLTKDYYVGVFEVTQRQWELVMGDNPSNWDGDTLPVEKVSYNDIRGTSNGSKWPASNAVDATSFMGKLRAKTGIDFDLPTEAQWEYACRSGSSGDWGLLADGTMGTLDAMGWYGDNSSSKTHLVGTKTPNAWGLYDMHGNVWEWCLDWDSSSGYSGSDPVGGTSGDCRVLHSGSWYYNDAYFCESSYRNSNNPDVRLNSYGLRVAAPAGIDIAQTYEVTFNANGGEGTMPAQTFTHGVEQALSANAFTREGYTFAGWATSADGTVAYTAGQSISITAPMTLYAVWEANTYEVNFNANGGEGTMPAQTFTHGVAQALSANAFTREGYTFAGWATSADGTVAYTASESISISAPMTLYAVWKAKTYTVTFKPNGAAGTMSSQTFTHGVAQAIKANAFTREGHTFAGWATCANGTVAYTAGQSISISAPMTLYAVWEANTYAVSFSANGGEGTMPAQTFTYGVAQALSANAFTRDGYTFAGWATSADGTVAYTAGQSISITAPMTLYAVWEANTYEVNFNANGGEGTMPAQTFTHGVAQALSANAFTREGYTFAGWATSADGDVVYSNCAVVNNLTTEANGIVNLFAIWEKTHKGVQLWADGPYWAETNIGAENPEDYGYYFWWGDTIGYKRSNNKWVASDGSSSHFSFQDSYTPTYGKYNSTLQSEGWITSGGVLAPEHDAAYAHWGEKWRMPTDDEFDALCDNCTWTWTTRNGINGYAVKGKGDYSSSSIFLPAAGYGLVTSRLLYAGSNGYYWSSVPDSGFTYFSWNLYFDSSDRYVDGHSRYNGHPVRPVSDVH